MLPNGLANGSAENSVRVSFNFQVQRNLSRIQSRLEKIEIQRNYCYEIVSVTRMSANGTAVRIDWKLWIENQRRIRDERKTSCC